MDSPPNQRGEVNGQSLPIREKASAIGGEVPSSVPTSPASIDNEKVSPTPTSREDQEREYKIYHRKRTALVFLLLCLGVAVWRFGSYFQYSRVGLSRPHSTQGPGHQSVNGSAAIVDDSVTVLRDGLYYLPNDDKPFTGITNENGDHERFVTQIVDGRRVSTVGYYKRMDKSQPNGSG